MARITPALARRLLSIEDESTESSHADKPHPMWRHALRSGIPTRICRLCLFIFLFNIVCIALIDRIEQSDTFRTDTALLVTSIVKGALRFFA